MQPRREVCWFFNGWELLDAARGIRNHPIVCSLTGATNWRPCGPGTGDSWGSTRQGSSQLKGCQRKGKPVSPSQSPSSTHPGPTWVSCPCCLPGRRRCPCGPIQACGCCGCLQSKRTARPGAYSPHHRRSLSSQGPLFAPPSLTVLGGGRAEVPHTGHRVTGSSRLDVLRPDALRCCQPHGCAQQGVRPTWRNK